MITRLRLPRWHEVLLQIYRSREDQRYCQRLNRKLKASLTHVRDTVRLLQDQGLVTIIPSKKIKLLALTEKGERIARRVMEIRAELKDRKAL